MASQSGNADSVASSTVQLYRGVLNLISYMSSHSRLAAGRLGASPDLVTGSATLGEQVRDLSKSTGKASSQIALSAAKLGIAKLRKRFTEGGR